MRLTCWGAAGEVTGSMHLLQVGAKRILLDCGLFQGRREEARKKNETFPLAPGDIDAVVVSHAHIDHTGRLPLLIKKGYAGRIFGEMTPCRAEVATIGGYSGHADKNELRRWVQGLEQTPQRAFAVHGETEQLHAMAELLRGLGVTQVDIPALGQPLEI